MTELPETMAAAVYHGPHDVRVEQWPLPEPGPGEVLVETGWCGVCGTDLHTVIDGWGRPGFVPGHEWSGTVVSVGDEVTAVTPGDRVVGGPDPTCGECAPCRAGRPSLCAERGMPGAIGGEVFQGAFARYVKTSEASAVKVPDGVDLRAAALTEPLAVALHAITLSGIREGQRAFVTGAGPIGALIIAALKAKGVDDIEVSEPTEARRDLATRLGASKVVAPDDLDVPTVAEPMRLRADPFEAAFECSGKAAAMEAALTQLGRAGTLVLVGTGMQPPQFDGNRILLNELVITGAYEYDAGGFPAALDLLASGKLPVDTLVEADDVPLGGLLDAFERLARGEIAGKVLIRPTTEED